MDLSKFKLFKQGAEACLYAGEFLDQSAVVKQRFSKKYRHPNLDLQLTKDRHKAEVRAILKCKSIGVRTPVLYLADNATNTIVMENILDSLTARDFIKTNLQIKNISKLENICKEIGCVVAKLHSNGIIHGDITTSNILVTNGSNIVMIDFGLSTIFMEGTPEDKGVDLYVLERAFLRLDMIKWSEDIRKTDYTYFCRAALQKYDTGNFPIWIVSDCRRKTDLRYFRENFGDRVKTVRIEAEDKVRQERGWTFTVSVDDAESECGLDDVENWDLILDNSGKKTKDELVQQVLHINPFLPTII